MECCVTIEDFVNDCSHVLFPWRSLHFVRKNLKRALVLTIKVTPSRDGAPLRKDCCRLRVQAWLLQGLNASVSQRHTRSSSEAHDTTTRLLWCTITNWRQSAALDSRDSALCFRSAARELPELRASNQCSGGGVRELRRKPTRPFRYGIICPKSKGARRCRHYNPPTV